MEKPSFGKRVFKGTMKTIAKFLYSVDEENMEKIEGYLKASDKNIFIANHPSFLDGIMLGLFLPKEPMFLVHESIIKRPVFKFLLSFVNYKTIDSQKPTSLKTIAKTVEEGHPVVIFPEGRISTTGSQMKIYDGTAFVAMKTQANIIPITLQGLLKSHISRMGDKFKEYPRELFPKVHIKAYDPEKINFTEEEQKLSGKQKRALAGDKLRLIMNKVTMKTLNKHHNIGDAYEDVINYFGKNHQIIEDVTTGEILSYKDMNLRIAGISYMLNKTLAKETKERKDISVELDGQKIQSGVVGLFLPNTSAAIASMLGIQNLGLVPAMLNYTHSIEAMKSCITSCQTKSIVTSRKFIVNGKLEHYVKLFDEMGVKVIYLDDEKEKMTLTDKLMIKKASMSLNTDRYKATKEEPATILFTSGSEGTPKGVVLSHGAVLSNISQIRSTIDIVPDDKVLNALPMFHSFGLTAGTLLPLLTGTRSVPYVSPLHYKVVAELAYDKNCTILFGTNTFLINYAKKAHNYDFYRMRYVIAGAEKVTDSTRHLFNEKFGLRIFEGYGTTECAPVISVNTPMANKFGTVGQFMPNIEYKLEEVPGVEKGGRLHVKGPNVMTGYLKDTKPGIVDQSSVPNGWYDTGDIVDINDGFISILGRAKRFVKIAGEMVSLEAVDKLVSKTSTANFATISRPDPRKGEEIILLTTDEHLKKEHIQKTISESNQSNLMLPAKIVYVSQIPLLGSGKTDYVGAKKLFELTQNPVVESVVKSEQIKPNLEKPTLEPSNTGLEERKQFTSSRL